MRCGWFSVVCGTGAVCRAGVLRGVCAVQVLWGHARTELVKRSKGARGMPRRGQAMKDVASCDKPWGGARIL